MARGCATLAGSAAGRPVVNVTDTALADIASMRCLHNLHLISCPQVTDAGLAYIAKIAGLRRLYVGSPNITDKGVSYLKNCVTLERLYLRDGKISNAALKYVKALPNLVQLSLDGTSVTEEGLLGLGDMTQLRLLQVRDLRLGHGEANQIKNVLPNCFIRYGSRKGGSPPLIGPPGVTAPNEH